MDRPTSSLLDRLIGDKDTPNDSVTWTTVVASSDGAGTASVPNTSLTRRQRGQQIAVLRSQIERDLLALFGTRRLSEDTDLSAWPMVQRSVLNYGVPDLSGSTGSSLDIKRVQNELTDAIKCFEPRLKPETLTVTCRINESVRGELGVDIEALFGPADALESFAMGISINLGNGQSQRTEANRLKRAG
jgi:type VI secretion system protein ImpF